MAPPETGEWWCEKWAGDGTVLSIRRDVIERRFRELFAQLSADESRGKLRSAVLSFAQYWNDNADDEVHPKVLVSRRQVPDWPHLCARDLEDDDAGDLDHFCSYCGSGAAGTWLDWGYGELIPSFEAYCHERGSQGRDDADNHRPFALARRTDDGRIEVEMIGRIVRPWLDMPTDLPPATPLDDTARALLEGSDAHVVADYWLERGDLRGEYLALALHPDPTDEMREQAFALWVEHHRSWMGAAAPFIPRGGARFARGFLTDAELYLPEDRASSFDPDEAALRTCERIRFLPGSLKKIGLGMQRARVLGPLDDEALEALVSRPEIFEVEELELDLVSDSSIDHLRRATNLPRLARLRLIGPRAAASAVTALLRVGRIKELAQLEIASPVSLAQEADLLARVSGEVPVRLVQMDRDAGTAEGWSITSARDGRSAIVERTALTEETGNDQLEAALVAIPKSIDVSLRPGPFWDPSEPTIERLRDAARRTIRIER